MFIGHAGHTVFFPVYGFFGRSTRRLSLDEFRSLGSRRGLIEKASDKTTSRGRLPARTAPTSRAASAKKSEEEANANHGVFTWCDRGTNVAGRRWMEESNWIKEKITALVISDPRLPAGNTLPFARSPVSRCAK